MRALNRRSLRHDYVTDVLAFPYGRAKGQGTIEHGRSLLAAEREAFGDIVICLPQARRQALRHGHSLLEELVILAAHGALHLAGYGDETPNRRRRMFRRQKAIARAVLGRRRRGSSADDRAP